MKKPDRALRDIHTADDAGGNGIHPLACLLVTILYILAVMSFQKYNMAGLAGMALYILILCIWYDISILDMLRHIWPAFLLTAMIGIANPIFDSTVSAGTLSMATLIVKGCLCAAAAYILIAQTGIRPLCSALRTLHFPKELIVVLLLMYRYLTALVREVKQMLTAYRLRTPGTKGLPFRTWGSFVGLLLLRSIDRAEEVYESMQLRGFQGDFLLSPGSYSPVWSAVYTVLWGIAIFALRFFPVFQMAEVLLWRILK